MIAVIHYSEIGLKGKNRGYFERKLILNIQQGFKNANMTAKVKRDYGRIVCALGNVKESKVADVLSRIFGIRFFGIGVAAKHEIDAIYETGRNIIAKLKKEGFSTIGIHTRRSDKEFPVKSDEINKKLGKEAEKVGFKIKLDDPDKLLRVEIAKDGCYFFTDKIKGLGGMPVGTAGKVLCLLSGGIDSAVAAWMLMKRGCRVDFLHFHTFAENGKVAKTKIPRMVSVLNQYQSPSKVFLAPYSEYEVSTMGHVPQQYDLVVFKHFMLKVAEAIAVKSAYRAIVTGDSLAQVASQTLGNIQATSLGITTLIFRPLIGFDKEDIMDLAKEIGTFELSIEAYKDCCSIKARKALTSVPVRKMEEVLSKVDVDSILKETLKWVN